MCHDLFIEDIGSARTVFQLKGSRWITLGRHGPGKKERGFTHWRVKRATHMKWFAFFFLVMSGLLVIKRCLWNPGTKCGGFQPTMFDYQMVQDVTDVWPKTKILGPNSKSNPMACSIYSIFSVYGIVSINPQVKACQWSQSRQRQISVARLAWYSLSWRWTIPDAYPFKDSLRQFYHERSRFLVAWTETTESLKEETKAETCAPEIGFVPLRPSSPSSINHLADFDTTWTKNRSLAT